MTRFTIAIIFTLFTFSGCTFDTDIDADVYDNGTVEGEDRCDGIRALLEGEEDADVSSELDAALQRCLDENLDDPGHQPPGDDPDNPNNPDDPTDPDDCEVVEVQTEDGAVVEERRCPGDDPDDPNNPDDCEIVEIQTADGEVVEERRCPGDGELSCEDLQIDADNPNGSQEAWEICLDHGYTDAECDELIRRCTGDETDPGNGDFCESAYEEFAQAGIDVDSLTRDEAFAMCIDAANLDEQLCEEVAATCFDHDDPNTDPADGCEDIEQYLADQGYQLPLSEDEADALYQECLDSFGMDQDGSSDMCDRILQCTG